MVPSFILRLPDLGSDLPSEIAEGKLVSVNQRHSAVCDRLVEFEPVFPLRFPADDNRSAARPHVGRTAGVSTPFILLCRHRLSRRRRQRAQVSDARLPDRTAMHAVALGAGHALPYPANEEDRYDDA